MTALPEIILEAWDKRERACVLTTVSEGGVPNTIYVSCCDIVSGNRILVCNSEFTKTLSNLESGRNIASFLFYAPDYAAYQLKGEISHHREGTVFEEGKGFAMETMDLKGVAEIKVTEVYKGSERLH